MASFFQPPASDPARRACESQGPQLFEVYCNSLLPPERRLLQWYQLATLIFACCTAGLPLLFWTIRFLVREISRLLFSKTRKKPPGASHGKAAVGQSVRLSALKTVKSFQILPGDGHQPDGFGSRDLVILPLNIPEGATAKRCIEAGPTIAAPTAAKLGFGCVDVADLDPLALSKSLLSSTSALLSAIYEVNQLSGLVIRCCAATAPDNIDELVASLSRDLIPVMIIGNNDTDVFKKIDFDNIIGVILENAFTTLAGERRDYFRSVPVRQVMTAAATQRELRPDFFIGVLDFWNKRPHTSLIRRSVKLAEHFGAVYDHGPTAEARPSIGDAPPASITVTGFDYLRRAECVELQKVWSLEKKPVVVSKVDSSGEPVTSLPLEDLQSVLPDVTSLLRPLPLPAELSEIRLEEPLQILPPEYTETAPQRANFWDFSADEGELSSLGCYPLNSTPSCEQYDAIIETQKHLRTLQMLQPLKGNEIHKLEEQFTAYCGASNFGDIVQALIDGLSHRNVSVYKGLDTGFGVPDDDSHFWGISTAGDDTLSGAVDIYLSLKSPTDASIILHTWLAHHGVSRIDRFEEEHKFESINGLSDASNLPATLRASVDRSTVAELLFIMEQLRMSQDEHPFREGIENLCRSILIGDTSKSAWKYEHSMRLLEGSLTIEELLLARLQDFARRGAAELPTLENLVLLYEAVDELVNNSLFRGDRDSLNVLCDALSQTYKPLVPDASPVDINTDLVASMFFLALRRSAFNDVYIESTDRCPFFLSQPDQAAVFAELWLLGSQCEIYFGVMPRSLGRIIYDKYKDYLTEHPPGVKIETGEMLTMYSISAKPLNDVEEVRDASSTAQLSTRQTVRVWKKRMLNFGAMSIFCLPAIVDVFILTFVGRGMFMTAFMPPNQLMAAGYALLLALLLTAGVTGWVGSTGNYYLANYAYDNMIYFHVQRLSAGFVLALVVALGGLIAFSITHDAITGLEFAAFHILVSTYFNLIGIMATMHQRGCPLTSGRTVLWRSYLILLISPILSSFVNGKDLIIYLPVGYGFVIITLFQYRSLCREWSSWITKIPKLSEKDILTWYTSKLEPQSSDEEISSDAQAKMAQEAFRNRVKAVMDGAERTDDPTVARIAKGIPYVDWLFQKSCPDGDLPELFTSSWFTQLGEAIKGQQQLARGLKEHNNMILFRIARYDLGQNLGLFLVALLDRWVALVTANKEVNVSMYTDHRARYGICLAIFYFCMAVILLDAELQNYWGERFKLSELKIRDYDHAQEIVDDWNRRRRATMKTAMVSLVAKISLLIGLETLLLWFLVESKDTLILYYAYLLGYSGVVMFQFNRCFTTDVRMHVSIIFFCATLGFVIGIVLHRMPISAGFLFNDVIAMNIASLSAATFTFIYAWYDFTPSAVKAGRERDVEVWVQPKLSTDGPGDDMLPAAKNKTPSGTTYKHNASNFVSQRVTDLLKSSADSQNDICSKVPWSVQVLETATNLWASRRIIAVVVSRDEFNASGFREANSFCRLEKGVMKIFLGMMNKDELSSDAWHPLLGQLITESILYYTARSYLALGQKRAVHAEHFVAETDDMSKRVDFELAQEDIASLTRMRRKTNVKLLDHLCLGIRVDAMWEAIPESGREAILSRIMGKTILLTKEAAAWFESEGVDMTTYDFHIGLVLEVYRRCKERYRTLVCFSSAGYNVNSEPRALLRPVTISNTKVSSLLADFGLAIVAIPVAIARWIAIISGAGGDIERELWYRLRRLPFRRHAIRAILLVWKFCWILKNAWLFVIIMYHRPALVNIWQLARKGAARRIVKNSIVMELPRNCVTGFASVGEQGTMQLDVYNGRHSEPPSGGETVFRAIYDSKFRLISRDDHQGGTVITTTYHYNQRSNQRWPVSKEVNNEFFRTVGFYDQHGRVIKGTLSLGTSDFSFQYYYKSTPKGNSDVLRADFKLADSPTGDSLSVYWGVPVGDEQEDNCNWVPSERVCRIVRKISGKTFVTTGEYKHKRDPVIRTVLDDNGVKTAVGKAPQVFPEEGLLLARPANLSFDNDDLLIYHRPGQLRRMKHAKPGASRALVSFLNPGDWFSLWGRTVYRRVPTWRIRTELWNNWLKTGTLDAVTACWMDEMVLREEPLLHDYWRARNAGRLDEAKTALEENIDQIVSSIEIETEVSEVCLLPIRPSDLYAMGSSKDATQVTNRPQDCIKDTENRISVIFNDTGCWPEAPGGVSNCRRDLVDGHSTIRNHVLAECANDFGIPRFQVEKNVQSLKLLPLWGLDGKTATHGLIDNLLQSQVDDKIRATHVQRDIIGTFIPLITTFVKGARSKSYRREDLITYSNVLLSLAKYFEQKDYNRTWASKEAERAWVEAWLIPYNDENIQDPAQTFELERPSMTDFRDALGIYLAYFFIFSVNIPDECPKVFQSTHHGISSLFGMTLKYRRGTTFGIWDHAILWRECCLNISPAQCALAIPVQSMLLAGIGMATRLAYLHADVVLPCTSLFNPMWEAEIGTDRGRMGSRALFSRKIDPIVNGISNMESFTPVDKIRTAKPTTVMLSNVQFIKGIKTAILAADILVNRFGFKDYNLVVYGAKDRQPAYAFEMAKLIVECNLSNNVNLAGFGKPKEVLKDAWLFMNSSISEGLPLAIGEAALAGVPIVATEVGATALVLTDPVDQEQRYGEVVPPNDPLGLARSQVALLSMVGQWVKFTEEETGPALPDIITPKEMVWLRERMDEKTEDRRKLGLMSREVVLHSFHGNRYLREHEQMYWIQWHQARMRADEILTAPARYSFRFGREPMLRYEEKEREEEETTAERVANRLTVIGDPVLKWQEFGAPKNEKAQTRRLTKPMSA